MPLLEDGIEDLPRRLEVISDRPILLDGKQPMDDAALLPVEGSSQNSENKAR